MILDKLSIVNIVILGGYYVFSNMQLFSELHICSITLTFVIVTWIYYYGYMTNQYCYHSDKAVADIFHWASLDHCLHLVARSFSMHNLTFVNVVFSLCGR